MKTTTLPKLHISLSREHNKYQSDVADAFKGIDVSFDGGLMRFSAEEMAMQVILNIGIGIASSAMWDGIKVGIKKLHKKFSNARITLRDSDSVMYTVKPDLSLTVLVVPNRVKEFEHIKNFDDLANYLRNNSRQSKNADWQLIPVGNVFDFVKSHAFSRDKLSNGILSGDKIGNIHYGDIHATFTSENIDLSKVEIPLIKADDFNPKKQELLKDGDLVMADVSENYEGIGETISVHGIRNNKVVGGLHTFVLRDNKGLTNEYYRQYIFRNPILRNKLQKNANGVSVYGVSKTTVSGLLLQLPPLSEQDRIVSVLQTWDNAIEKISKKIESKKLIKHCLMRDLLMCKKRLSGFKNKWQTVEIGELLDYEQPTKYIVNDTDYSYKHKIPVLTANKGFILGYTNEKEGVYTKTPAIIFDDFTMDNKFVDFDFKVKSSAIKILTPKNESVNLKFVFERMQLINIVIGEHRRHYLSEYQYLTIDVPDIKEQNAIEKILTTADTEIKELEKKLQIIKDQKKYLLNNLITGTIRTPETLSAKITK